MYTWNDLLTRLQEMSAAELEQTATVYDSCWDEFFPLIEGLGMSQDGDVADGVLDHGHFYLRIGDNK
jgi:hypothetical protein